MTIKDNLRRRPAPWLLLLLLLVNLALYSPTLHFDFLKDDHVLVENNPRVKNGRVFVQTLGKKFFAFPDFPFLHYWRPLTLLSYRVDYLLWGQDPFGFHLTNVLLNAAVAVLIFLFFLAWGGGRPHEAFFVGLWFTLFPLHAENVAWISGRPDLLAALLALAASLLFLRYLETGKRVFLILVFFVFIPGLFVKENLAVFPLIALAITWGRGKWRRGRLPVAVLTLVSMIFAWIHIMISGSGGSLARASFSQVPLMLKTMGVYARMILVPVLPDPYFAMARFDSTTLEWLAWGLLAMVVLIAVVRKKEKWTYMTGALGFLFLLAPVINPDLVPSSPPVAIRFVYLPAVLGGCLLMDLWRRLGRRRVVVISLAVGMGLGFAGVNLTYQKYFQDDETFFSRLVPNHPEDSLLLLSLALKRAGEKRYDEALALVRRGSEVSRASRWVDVGEMSSLLEANLLLVTGDPRGGFLRAEKIARESAQEGMRFKALMIVARYYRMRREYDLGLAALDRAGELGVTGELWLQRCLLLARMGRWEEAETAMAEARRLNPELTDFPRLLRLLRLRDGKMRKGTEQPAPVRRGEQEQSVQVTAGPGPGFAA